MSLTVASRIILVNSLHSKLILSSSFFQIHHFRTKHYIKHKTNLMFDFLNILKNIEKNDFYHNTEKLK